MEITRQLHADHGLPLVGVPKTIDNDVGGTDFTFGFDTAVQIVTDAIDRLHTTAQSHDRVMVVEVMGRSTGWIAAYAGLAGGADAIVIPETTTTVEEVAEGVERRHDRDKDFSIVVVAEGAKLAFAGGEERLIQPIKDTDEYGYPRLGGIGAALATELESLHRVRDPGHRARPRPAGRHPDLDRPHPRHPLRRLRLRAGQGRRLRQDGRAPRHRDGRRSRSSRPIEVKPLDLEILEIAKRFFT